MNVLVTGATGYIGGELVPALLAAGHRVRVLSRRAGALDDRSWGDRVALAVGDASEEEDLYRAMDGVEVAYHLLHSMDGQDDFAGRDRRIAEAFAAAADRAGVRRIVHLGGIHPDQASLSPHMASRREVADILLNGPVPAVVLRAAVILGAGSASYAMLRHLTSRLPVMITPKWVQNRVQPIAIADVRHYLVGAAEMPGELNRTFDIAGPDVLTYAEMMQRFAALNDLGPRPVVSIPVLTPWLASHWVGLITPVSPGVAKPLVGSLVDDAVAAEHDIDDHLPPPLGGPTSFDEAVREAEDQLEPDTALRDVAGGLLAVGAVAAAMVASRLRR